MLYGGGEVCFHIGSGHVGGQLEDVPAFITGPTMKNASSVPFSNGQLGAFMCSEWTGKQPFPALSARFSKLAAAICKQGFRFPELIKVYFCVHVRAVCCM